MNSYVDVILPLALPQVLTYRLPASLQARVGVGSRVVVPLGKRKFYSAIVSRIHSEEPQGEYEIKDVSDLVDEKPLIGTEQIDFWKWIASYYMCTLGEVMKAALPAGLKLESEMRLLREEDFDGADDLPPREAYVLSLLSATEPKTLASLQKEASGAGVLPAVKRLIGCGALRVEEHMARQYRPRTETHVRLCEDYFDAQKLNTLLDSLKRSPKQENMLLLYAELAELDAAFTLQNYKLLAEVSKKKLLHTAGGGESALTALRQKGILETYAYETGRLKTAKAVEGLPERELTEAQHQAIDRIKENLKDKTCCLLHGVTSSGKTEIYIQLIKEQLRAGKQVLYLLPEIALTTQIMQRLGRVFGEQMGVYHSKFPDNERVEIYQRMASPDKAFGLLLGVRSALFLPYHKLGLIIIDEEHETSFKQQEPAPRYNARDAAIVLAKMAGAKVVLGTATPSLETYHNALTGKYGFAELSTRYGNMQLPEIIVEDIGELRRKKLMPTPFAPRLIEEIRLALSRGEQAILFQNRRGYSPQLSCSNCGWTPRCSRCDVALTFHQKENKLVCHYCGATYALPTQCPECGEHQLRDLGFGTEKIEAAVKAVFPSAKTARLDLDTTRQRSSYESILSDFAAGKTNILIGTQMVTKGLDFGGVSVVGILSADQLLSAPDFRAYERGFQLMSQVAGRAGRKKRRGKVILQTRQPDLEVVEQVCRHDFKGFYEDTIAEREAFMYPPFTRIIEIYLKHREEKTVTAAAQRLASMLQPHFTKEELLGPDKPVVAWVQLQHIRKFLLKIVPSMPPMGLRHTLNAARDILIGQPDMKGLTITFNVDPL